MRKKDPKIDKGLDSSALKSIATDSTVYEDMYITGSLYVDLVAAGHNGVFVFVSVDDFKNITRISAEIKAFLGCECYLFFFSGEETKVVYGQETAGADDIYTAFACIYDNTRRPYAVRTGLNLNSLESLLNEPEIEDDGEEVLHGKTYEHDGVIYEINDEEHTEDTGDMSFVKYDIDTTTLNSIDEKLCPIEGNDRPIKDYKVDEDGTEYVLKNKPVRLLGMDTGLAGEKTWYRLSDKDPDRLCLLTALGGCFGAHKFAEGRFGTGLLYLLTFGCLGILPAMDLLMQILGASYYDETDYIEEGRKVRREVARVYLKKPSNIKLALLFIPICIIIGLLLAKFVYVPVLTGISSFLATKAGSFSEDDAKNILEQTGKVGQFLK